MGKQGEVRATTSEFVAMQPGKPYRLILAEQAVDESDIFLFHKTTKRRCYEGFSQLYPDYDDVLLQNRRGEITESLIANLIVEIDGQKYTPPLECGLLAGTCRQYLLDKGFVSERTIYRSDLENADKIYLANSVRKTWQVSLANKCHSLD